MQDQYVNHIMNETGSTVLLKGRGSGNIQTSNPEGSIYIISLMSFHIYFLTYKFSISIYISEQQPMHLYLSSSNPKSLEHAKLLAENLLDTICAECGASRYYFVTSWQSRGPIFEGNYF